MPLNEEELQPGRQGGILARIVPGFRAKIPFRCFPPLRAKATVFPDASMMRLVRLSPGCVTEVTAAPGSDEEISQMARGRRRLGGGGVGVSGKLCLKRESGKPGISSLPL